MSDRDDVLKGKRNPFANALREHVHYDRPTNVLERYAQGSFSKSASSDIRIIQALPVPGADKVALTRARVLIADMSDHQVDVLEGSLSSGATSLAEFASIPEDSLRAFIVSEREARTMRSDRTVTVWGFVITNAVVIAATLLNIWFE
jgi:hypothetical protein